MRHDTFIARCTVTVADNFLMDNLKSCNDIVTVVSFLLFCILHVYQMSLIFSFKTHDEVIYYAPIQIFVYNLSSVR